MCRKDVPVGMVMGILVSEHVTSVIAAGMETIILCGLTLHIRKTAKNLIMFEVVEY
jgi:hypothetical protein